MKKILKTMVVVGATMLVSAKASAGGKCAFILKQVTNVQGLLAISEGSSSGTFMKPEKCEKLVIGAASADSEAQMFGLYKFTGKKNQFIFKLVNYSKSTGVVIDDISPLDFQSTLMHHFGRTDL